MPTSKPTLPTVLIPYNTMLRYFLEHQADIAIAMRPSAQTLPARLLLLRDSFAILRNRLARHGITIELDPVPIEHPKAPEVP